jgi:DNA repair exonuclease SbcCD nuclease subunit
MVAALRDVTSGSGDEPAQPVDLVVITGDLFNSSTLPADAAVPRFRELYDKLSACLKGPLTVIVPGNHDVRAVGVFGRHSASLFRQLAAAFAAEPKVHVHGHDLPFLAGRLPAAWQ